MNEYKITKERLQAMADECPEVGRALKRGFPEAFKLEDVWEDISSDVTWKSFTASTGYFFLEGYYEGVDIVFFDADGLFMRTFVGDESFKVEQHNTWYRILKRRSKQG